jgi:sensor histidine kinase YesM
LADNGLITGVYAVFPKKDMSVVNSSYSSYQKVLINYVNEKILEGNLDYLKKWEVVQVGNSNIIFFIAQYKNAYYGAWIDLTRLANKMGITAEDQDTVMAFTDDTGKISYSNEKNLDKVELNEPYKEYEKESYILVKAASKYANLYMIQILSKSEIANALPSMLKLLQVFSIIALCIIPILMLALRKWMITPINHLSIAMKEIEKGNMDYRIVENKRVGSEFEQINRNFNSMMHEVSRLKIDVYEEQLKNKDINMRFLSQQIQPHFILNAMNILYSYEPEEYSLIQKMILCLSRYFRYVVNANVDFVRLDQEMAHIKNYFEIQQARYPKTFFAVVEFDENIGDCLVPPLLIQNFAENSIKHSLQIDNKIDIFVIGQNVDDKYIRIRILDTGAGIRDELIEKVEQFQKTRINQEGLGVGVQNAIERLDNIYGGEAHLKISKVNPHGTEVNMIIPLRRRDESEYAERDFD